MASWKKHAAFPALAAAIILLLAIALNMYAKRDDGLFVMKDLIGSRDAIGDVAISGELRDGYHRTLFRLQEGQLNTSTEVFEQQRLAESYRYIPGGVKRMDDREYSVYGISTFDITSRKQSKDGGYYIPDGTALVAPPISYGRNADNSITYANPLEYGLAKAGGKVFFTVPVFADSTGTSGIYELRFSEWGFPLSLVDREAYAARKIADISLEANASGKPPGIEVLGLEAVGSKLVLLSTEHNELRIRSYESDSGKLLGEAVVPDFYLPARPGTAPSEHAGTYYENYEAYSDSEHDMLNLSFRGSSAQQRLMLSIDFSDGVKVVNTVKTAFTDGEEDSIRSLSYMSYRNGKLYVVKMLREPRADANDPAYDLALPLHFYIYVYEKSKLVYKGELATDMNEDNIQSISQAATRGGYNYDQKDFRYFTNVAVE
jgi:hypothetical protein